MSRSSRSGGLFSTVRRAASPLRATLILYSPRSASTSMSTFAFTSSTISTRHSDRFLTATLPLDSHGAGRALQRFERALEVVGVDLAREPVKGGGAAEESMKQVPLA